MSSPLEKLMNQAVVSGGSAVITTLWAPWTSTVSGVLSQFQLEVTPRSVVEIWTAHERMIQGQGVASLSTRA